MSEEAGSPHLQPEAIPLPSTPTSPSHLQIPRLPPSPVRPTHASTPSSSSASTAASSSSKLRPVPQPLILSSSSPPNSSQLAAVVAVAPFVHQSELPSIATRRANSGMKSGRELLLPIGVTPKSGLPSDLGSPTSSTKTRTSLDKIVRRDGVTTTDKPVSPSSANIPLYSVSPRQARFAHNLMDNDGNVPPRSPRSIRSRHSAQSLVPPSPSRSAMMVPVPGTATSEHFPPSPQSPDEPRQVTKQASAASLNPPPPHIAVKSRQPSSKHPFSPHPPPGARPFVPHISKITGKPQRNYEDHPSKNRFFLNGRILTGGDTPIPFILSFTLVLGIAGTWFGTTAVWWWHNESPAVAIVGAYLCLLTISSMLATVRVPGKITHVFNKKALRDPGILPRDLDPDPPYPASSPSDGAPKMPLPREIRIRDGMSPRASHCKTCDNCVDGCDHHCQWVNNCVGRRNYTSFITFIVIANLTLALVIVTSALHLFNITRQDHVSFGRALHTTAGSAVVFALGIVVIWPLLSLLGYHIRLLLLNITTIEQLRNKYERQISEGPPQPMYNPFSFGKWYRNVAYLLCRPEGSTWIEASAIKLDDQRQINPGAYEDWDFIDRDETASMRKA
ncbi:hypothetical protein Clacol_006826 [Clathrus columnatus]|uniref:Palmitoyltransferase n=1 Tax=Clathrus columnatus TaxID=1419009 RepID=A0AAV5AIR7_9AGAM|nr:hypothetical protein Clacol_006826 [Clathrus columnatus]